ncbi:ATP-dependent helicase [Picrophilus oshimae]|uniref:ATP-dependent helicase n=1 Tax=Picrophilus torridus (strain ATCC 700027 / DSM 9790 / JCM 10055 / NBRC 100828 / KAW 2/3) TaxID=1122961 RepID=Q6L0N7_PICTO|nr:ATP-dependent helicase [Picrophilus oshimae]AAT43465.1 ATP-dependent helicase [Picrophilus oshimae DSM 9789]
MYTDFRIEDEFPFLDPVVAEWFNSKYDSLSEPQRYGIPLIHNKNNVLVSSPTGTGKTLTGFLSIINELFIKARSGSLEDKIYCVYISPLKALANDVNKNLKTPLNEIYEIARSHGIDLPDIRIAVRSGDTDARERARMLSKPPHILITTPESLSLVLTANKFREKFFGVEYVIVDEIHEISSTKRGSLLSLNLERLAYIAGNFVRIGLSATQAPLDLIAAYLCGYDGEKRRECRIIEVNTNKYLDLRVITPSKDLTKVSYEIATEKMYDIIVDLVNSHKTTLIFTNTRGSTEHVAMRLKARGIENIEAHHSSLGKETRVDVENKLKRGELKCVITSTSLELGIDIGYIDLVIQIGSPKSVSRALQRIGRSGHGVRDFSKGRLVVFDIDDLMECTVLTRAAYDHNIDKVQVPLNPLDVLSQALVGMALEKTWNVDEAYKIIKNSFSFHTLDYRDFIYTLKYLSGKIEGNTIYSKIWYDEETSTFGKKRSTRLIYFMNVGTIPDEANYNVFNDHGRMIGQLSDKFVEKLRQGDIFVLGARTYKFIKTVRNRVMVSDATGMTPTVPSWTGELLPRSYDLGVLIGRFRKELASMDDNSAKEWLMKNYYIDEFGAMSLVSYIKAQKPYGIPSEDFLLIEGYMDKNYNIIFHIPLGRRVNDALSRAYAYIISNNYDVNARISVNDNGFMISFDKRIEIKDVIRMLTSRNFDDILKRSIENTEMFKQRFRYCATRALMVLRKYKSADVPVTRQQLRSDKLLRVLENMDNFPVIKETYNEILNDVMDMEHALLYIKNVIEKGRFKINDYSRETSPFSYNLIISGASDVVLMEDKSKLLREFQNKLLDKIYGSSINFLVNDARLVENYYKNNVPRIDSIESYMDFARHFPYIDPFKRRFNGPYDYSIIDIENATEELINSDKIVSVFIRSTQWTSIDYYNIFYTLFRKEHELNDVDKMIYDVIDNTSFKEIKLKTKLDDDVIESSLIKLESSYIIRKHVKDKITIYIKNDIKPGEINRIDAIKRAIELTLGAYGPLSFDELIIKIPVNESEMESALNDLIMNKTVVNDYITPMFVRQYILSSDLKNLVNVNNDDINKKRINYFSQPCDTIEDYFDKYGFAFSLENIKSRVKNFNYNNLKSLMESGAVYYTRAIKNRYVYIAKWLLDTLYYLRRENPGRNDERIIKYIEDGLGINEISKLTGLGDSVVKAIVKDLEYRLEIINDGKRIYKYKPGNDVRDLVDKFGPVTLKELTRFFWVSPSRIDLSGRVPLYYKNEVYYGDIRDSGPSRIIVNVLDPLLIYLGKFSDNDSSIFIDDGHESGFMRIFNSGSVLWIEGLELESGSEKSFLDYINSRYFNYSIVIDNSDLHDDKYKRYGRYLCNTNALVINSMNDLISMFTPEMIEQPLNYNKLERLHLGIRTDVEGIYTGIKPADMEKYFESGFLYIINGPFDSSTYITKNMISLYRSIRSRKLNDIEERIVKILLNDSKTESELIRDIHESYMVKSAIKSLFKINAVARDYKRRYVFIHESISRKDAIKTMLKSILNTFGFFDDEHYKRMFSVDIDNDYIDAVRELKMENKIADAIVLDEKKLVYLSVEKNNHNNGTMVVTPKDLFYLYYSDYLKARYGSSYILMYDGKIKTSFSVKKSGRFLMIENNDYMDLIKSEMSSAGYIVNSK